MVTSLKTKRIYEFGAFRLDPDEKVLMRDRQAVAIPPKDLETLLVLVERAGHIVEKDELMERVWPGVFIEEGNLSRRIFNLRQVLGEGPDGRQYIETVPKRGYRFVGLIQEQGHSTAPALAIPNVPEHSPPTTPHLNWRGWWLWAAVAVVGIAVTLLAQRLWLGRSFSTNRRCWRCFPL